MTDSIFRYVLTRLSVMTDDQLEKLDFDAGLTVINNTDLKQYDTQKLKVLFSSIQKNITLTYHGVLGMKCLILL